MKKIALLALEDGTIFYGCSSSPHSRRCAEVVFNTAMTGYQEVCTDPSYANQMVVFTASHIGNVGVNINDCESKRVWVEGVIVREISTYTSSWRAEKSLIAFLNENNTPWIEGIDTRKLVRHIRETGCQNGCIMIGEKVPTLAIQLAREHLQAKGLDLSRIATQQQIYNWPLNKLDEVEKEPLIYVYDFGVKLNILKKLEERPCRIKIIPGDYSVEQVLAIRPDGIVLSNGPGDPTSSPELVENVKKLIYSRIPILGICFGFQLIGIAAKGKATKMKFGHHGINHPVYDIAKKRVYITSQNHNFMIDRSDFPDSLEITHFSLFDESIQGFRMKEYPVIAFQGHPEGAPGPQDFSSFFENFFQQIYLNTGNTASCP